MQTFFLVYLMVINITAFNLYAADKHKARKHLWRIPERTLFLAAILGGSIGSLLAMYLLHHKTRHALFFIGVPLIFILQVIAAFYLIIVR